MTKINSMASFLNDPEWRRKVLEESQAESRGDLLGQVPAYSLDGKPLAPVDPEGGWIRTKRPDPREVDYSRSSDDLILSDKVIRKDGRRITFGQ